MGFFKDLFTSDPDDAYQENPRRADSAAETFNERFVFWGMNNLPIRAASTHFLVCGTPGSGKTITIRLFLKSIAPRTSRRREVMDRLIVFDAKRDMLQLLRQMGLDPKTPFTILNPFHPDSLRWDLARDISTRALARYFATLLVPQETNSNAPFFSDAARQILLAVLVAFMNRWPAWTFRDLLHAVRSKERIETITKECEPARDLAFPLTADEKHFPSVLSTLATKVGKFEEIAALWHKNPNATAFSVDTFMAQGGILLLGNEPVFHESLWPINALILKVLTDKILVGPELAPSDPPHTWLVLDEFRWMGRVDCIRQILNQGRSKGASLVLGVQDVDGVKAVYGDHEANEILSQCANKTFLRAGSHATAEWAEKHFGHIRHRERSQNASVTQSYSSEGSSVSQQVGVQDQLQDRPLFLASIFADMPLPGSGRFVAIQDLPSLNPRTVLTDIPMERVDVLLGGGPPPADPRATAQRPPEDQELDSWSDEEKKTFGLDEKKLPSRDKAQRDREARAFYANKGQPGREH